MKKYLTLACVLMSSIFFVKAQVNSGNPFSPTIFSNSPNAASLGQYSPTDVDLYSGQPNINFNLFNFSKEGYNLNMDLNYNLSSIKPDTPPTWTGAGWNLNVGGVITRTVKGGVDEVMVSSDPIQNKYSYYDNYNTLDTPSWDSDAARNQFIYNNRSIGGGNRTVYPAPDEFNFNVNGMSGTFYKNHAGQWIIASGDFKDIKIDSELASNFSLYEDGRNSINNKTFIIKRVIFGFTLTDKMGIKYIFGKTPQSIEFSATPQSSTTDSFNPHIIANSWFLTKVILPSNFEIIYNYERENKALFKMHHTFASTYYYVNSGTTSGSLQAITKNPEKTFVTYLKSININNLYTIDFFKSIANVEQYNFTDTTNSKWLSSYGYSHHFRGDIISAKQFYKLDKITVKKNAIINQIDFSYLEDPGKKLFLTSFNKNGQLYQMEYYSTDLPLFNQLKNDHWGYYNDKSYLTSVIPANGLKYSVDQLKNVLPTFKETDPSQLTKGVLKKIIYPTKGFNEFIYEAHDYNKIIEVQNFSPFDFFIEPTTKKIAGGLRIRKTISNPIDAQSIIKEYFYTTNGNPNENSTGILSGKPVYFEEDSNNGSHIYRFADMPILPANNTRGKHIVYSKVTEKVSESTGGGTTEYIFSNSDNGFLDKRANAFSFFSLGGSSLYNSLRSMHYNSLEFERGKPLEITQKDQGGNIVQKTNFKYNDSPGRFDNTIRSYDFQSNVYGEPIYYGMYTYMHGMTELIRLSAYNIYSYNPYLSEKQDIYYFNNNPTLTETTKYTYGSAQHNQVTTKTLSDTSGMTLASLYKYAYEKGNQLMIDKNMIGIPMEATTSKIIGTDTKILSKSETIYPSSIPTAQTGNLVLPTSTLSYDLQNPAASSTEVTYDQYDSKGNVQQYTTKDGISTAIIWGYNETQPIAKITGATYAQVSSLASAIVTASDTDGQSPPMSDETTFLQALDNFRKESALSNYQVSTYSYDPLIGVTSITPPSGIREVYLYDSFNRLKEIREDNAGGKIIKEFKYNYKQ